MQVTNLMGLTKWDQLTDAYDHVELATNWELVDEHDHTTGKGKQIPTGGIVPGAITTNLINNQAVTTVKIGDGAVQTNNLADGSVTADKLQQSLFAAVLPLGAVIAWYRHPGSSATVPAGFVLCVGGSTTQHDFPGGGSIPIPNLVDTFVMGVNTGAGERSTGGLNSRNLDHYHNIQDHTHNGPAHTHDIGNHQHQVDNHAHGINADGSHAHTFAGGLAMAQRPYEISAGGTPRQAAYISGFNSGSSSAPVGVDATGSHAHGGATTGSAPLTSFNGATTSTSAGNGVTSGMNNLGSKQATGGAVGLGTVDARPQFYGLLYIMKVRNRTV